MRSRTLRALAKPRGLTTKAVPLNQLPQPGDSSEQREAEVELLSALALAQGLVLESGKRVLPDGARIEIDAISLEPPTLVKAWAHLGRPKWRRSTKL